DFVVVEIDGHAHERPAEAILISRIEIKVDVAIAVHRAVAGGAAIDGAEVIVLQGLFPLRAPGRGARRHRGDLDRSPVGLHLPDIAAADKAEWAVIEIVTVELVDAHADRAGGDKWIEVVF